jgi:hypothetical protein
MLEKQVLYYLGCPSCRFCTGNVLDRVLLYAQAGLDIVLPHVAGITGMYHCVQPLLVGSHELFAWVL